ncbi:MAG: hypothetical protein LBF75_06040 [Treponema sp.]|jgi:hypothetical protein|nr:hypothetical protein [Treponema sp.]
MAEEGDKIIEQLRGCTASLIRKAPARAADFRPEIAAVDIDPSVLDNLKTKQEGVSRRYQG